MGLQQEKIESRVKEQVPVSRSDREKRIGECVSSINIQFDSEGAVERSKVESFLHIRL